LAGQDLEIKIKEQPSVINGYALALKMRTWVGGTPGGYDLAFTIEVEDSDCK
jgi:hypothetical protein